MAHSTDLLCKATLFFGKFPCLWKTWTKTINFLLNWLRTRYCNMWTKGYAPLVFASGLELFSARLAPQARNTSFLQYLFQLSLWPQGPHSSPGSRPVFIKTMPRYVAFVWPVELSQKRNGFNGQLLFSRLLKNSRSGLLPLTFEGLR